jgi:hypothetical protein
LEVPGNITLRPYRDRIRFIRRVVHLFTASLIVVAALSFLPALGLSSVSIAGALIALLLLLDFLRIRLRGKPLEARISACFLPLVLLVFGVAAADFSRHGWPVWGALLGGGAVWIYMIVCGIDFSFVGCYTLSLLVSSLGVAGVGFFFNLKSETIFHATLLNFVFLSYSVYDLASLLARRRETESLAAVVDLYRDLFNFVGYFWRCVHHWRKHNIWVVPK